MARAAATRSGGWCRTRCRGGVGSGRPGRASILSPSRRQCGERVSAYCPCHLNPRSTREQRQFGNRKFASPKESVGAFWHWKLAQHVMQREFGDPERPLAVRFSQCDYGFVVQALDNAAGELLLGPQVVDQQLPARAHRSGKPLSRIDARSHRPLAQGIKELGGPGR